MKVESQDDNVPVVDDKRYILESLEHFGSEQAMGVGYKPDYDLDRFVWRAKEHAFIIRYPFPLRGYYATISVQKP